MTKLIYLGKIEEFSMVTFSKKFNPIKIFFRKWELVNSNFGIISIFGNISTYITQPITYQNYYLKPQKMNKDSVFLRELSEREFNTQTKESLLVMEPRVEPCFTKHVEISYTDEKILKQLKMKEMLQVNSSNFINLEKHKIQTNEKKYFFFIEEKIEEKRKKQVRKEKNLKYGLWTEEEHQKFIDGYSKIGNKWTRIAREFVKTRTPMQVITHAQKYYPKERIKK
jgi:SHAQKYF class myb-like DNA-binding protein